MKAEGSTGETVATARRIAGEAAAETATHTIGEDTRAGAGSGGGPGATTAAPEVLLTRGVVTSLPPVPESAAVTTRMAGVGPAAATRAGVRGTHSILRTQWGTMGRSPSVVCPATA